MPPPPWHNAKSAAHPWRCSSNLTATSLNDFRVMKDGYMSGHAGEKRVEGNQAVSGRHEVSGRLKRRNLQRRKSRRPITQKPLKIQGRIWGVPYSAAPPAVKGAPILLRPHLRPRVIHSRSTVVTYFPHRPRPLRTLSHPPLRYPHRDQFWPRNHRKLPPPRHPPPTPSPRPSPLRPELPPHLLTRHPQHQVLHKQPSLGQNPPSGQNPTTNTT